jgi:transcriptional regulator GlxA family with amidase domain
MRYVLSLRMQGAKSLLLQSQETVAAVAAQGGYESEDFAKRVQARGRLSARPYRHKRERVGFPILPASQHSELPEPKSGTC